MAEILTPIILGSDGWGYWVEDKGKGIVEIRFNSASSLCSAIEEWRKVDPARFENLKPYALPVIPEDHFFRSTVLLYDIPK